MGIILPVSSSDLSKLSTSLKKLNVKESSEFDGIALQKMASDLVCGFNHSVALKREITVDKIKTLLVNEERWLALSDKDIDAIFAEIRKDIPAEKKLKAINRLCNLSKCCESVILKEPSRNNPFYKLNVPLSVSRDLWLHVLETLPTAVKEKAIHDSFNVKEMVANFICFLVATQKVSLKSFSRYCSNITLSKENFDFLKKVFKYHLYMNYNWVQVGYGDYMTGDWISACGMLKCNENITLKYVSSKDVSQRGLNKRLSNDDFIQTKTLFLTDPHENRVKLSVKNGDREPKKKMGAKDFVSKKFSGHGDMSLRMPWNKHITITHSIVSSSSEKMRSFMTSLPTLLRSDQLADIASLYNSLEVGDKPIILWGRQSGHNGGAHKDLDSDPIVFSKLVPRLKKEFPEQKILFFGDKLPDLQAFDFEDSQFKYMPELWKCENSPIKGQVQQRVFLSMFKNANAVNVGMRSGNLEMFDSVSVIFLDSRSDTKKKWSSGRKLFRFGISA